MSLLFIAFSFFLSLTKSKEYAIVIDGGTSSSKFSVFSFDDIRRINQETYFKVYPGVYNFADNLNEITNLYIPAIFQCLEHVPKSKQTTTPIYWGGTSGMRSLPKVKRNGVVKHIQTLIKDNFNLRFKDRFVRTLSGSEEGMYGWLSVNLLLENGFNSETIRGCLDMGSGSNQLVFLPDEDILDSKMFVNALSGVLQIYTGSFQSYGEDRAYEASRNVLIAENENSTHLEHPCLYEGTGDVDPVTGVVFNGTSDPTSCKALIRKVLGVANFCHFEHCTVSGKYVPAIPKTKKFIAMSGYWYQIEGVGLEDSQTPEGVSLQEFFDAAENLCSKNIHEANLLSGMEEDERIWQCFSTYHDLLLLNEFHGFDLESRNILFVQKVNGKKVSWTPGMLFFETETMTYLPTLFASSPENVVAYQSLTYTFGSLFVVFVFVVFVLLIVILVLVCLYLHSKDTDGGKNLVDQVIKTSSQPKSTELQSIVVKPNNRKIAISEPSKMKENEINIEEKVEIEKEEPLVDLQEEPNFDGSTDGESEFEGESEYETATESEGE